MAEFGCHRHHCTGVYMFEHFNLSTLQYDVIYEGSHNYTIAVVDLHDGGSYRCSKKCNRKQTAYCYLGIKVIPNVVEMDFPQATINTSYNGTCWATGNPRPVVYAAINADDCPYTLSSANISQYRTEVTVTIPHVTTQCRDVTIRCHICHITEKVTLNVTEPTQQEPLPTNSDDYNLTNTTTTTVVPTIVPTVSPTISGSAESTRSTSLVKLVFVAVILIYFG
ncbi:uncharacterized protein [Dysidea avara]